MTEGAPRGPLRILVAVVEVLTDHWTTVPDKRGGPGTALICPRCPESQYYGFFKVPGMPHRQCPNCGTWLEHKEAR